MIYELCYIVNIVTYPFLLYLLLPIFIVMEASTKMIKRVLEHLVSPKWNGIVEYQIEPSTHDDTGVVHYMIDVIFDIAGYWATYDAGGYNDSSQMDGEIETDVKNAVKYLGINKTFVAIYVRNEDGIDN
jgi:hypothetical protein